jgi:hypothetical protein
MRFTDCDFFAEGRLTNELALAKQEGQHSSHPPYIPPLRSFVVAYSTIGIPFSSRCPFLVTNATFCAITRYIDGRSTDLLPDIGST